MRRAAHPARRHCARESTSPGPKRMVRRKSAGGARGQVFQLPRQHDHMRSLGMTRVVTLEMDAPSPARRVPVPKLHSPSSPGKSSPQPPASTASHRAPSSASVAISVLQPSSLIPEFVDKTMDYRPVALKLSHGERVLCERVRTSKNSALVCVTVCVCLRVRARVCVCLCASVFVHSPAQTTFSGADHYGLHGATYTAGLPDGRGSPTQRSPQRRPAQKGNRARSRSVEQLIVGTPKWYAASSGSQDLDFENWKEAEREGAKGLAAIAEQSYVP